MRVRTVTTRRRRRGRSNAKAVAQRYVLVGCIGIPPAAREHVFAVYDCAGAERVCVGYMTPDEAVDRFGLDQLYMSLSHGGCPECEARLDDWERETAPVFDSPDEPDRLGIVSMCRRPLTVIDLRRLQPARVSSLPGDLEILIRAGYIERQRSRGAVRCVATLKGLEACLAGLERLITPNRLNFRGAHDPLWDRTLARRAWWARLCAQRRARGRKG